MEKNKTLIGWIFIILTLFFGSLFTASLVMVWKTNELTIWIIPLIAGLLCVWFIAIQILCPLWREYRKPRTQRQFDNIKPLFQFSLMLILIHICLSIALGGIWVYFFKGHDAGIQMGATGLILLTLPLVYTMWVPIKNIK